MNDEEKVMEYIHSFDKKTNLLLSSIRNIVREEVPESVELFSYGMPGYKLNKKPLIYFAAFKNHIGVYTAPLKSPLFIDEVAKYKQGKGSIQFPFDKELPLDLIRRMVRYKREMIVQKKSN